jgi:Protein of unknown function (DUF1501)
MQIPDCLNPSRRAFLRNAATGIGAIALKSLLARDLAGQTPRPGPAGAAALHPLHHAARAKRVIFLYMAGGPSHLETLDPKPTLAAVHGQPIPESITGGQPFSPHNRATNVCVAPQTAFRRCGQSGHELATVFPRLAAVADDLCIIRSMQTDTFVHDPAHTLMCTGSMLPGHPSIGSWLWYGLGSECDNLPGFVVLLSLGELFAHPLTRHIWNNGFLPTQFQGVEFRATGDPVLYLRNGPGVTPSRQRDVVETIQALDRIAAGATERADVAAHISRYEMAFRMQTSVPDLVDLSQESRETLDLYGTRGFDGSFATNCLLARRLAERGVRFIQLVHLDWDHHQRIRNGIRVTAREVDQGMTALLIDLKRRGLLDDTLVVWGGEFGRTPTTQGDVDDPGRDHHRFAFSMWLAGGGVRPGHVHGATDEFGFQVVEDPVHVHDLHATILHLLGVDHQRLTYQHQGREQRLTDVAGNVIRDILR